MQSLGTPLPNDPAMDCNSSNMDPDNDSANHQLQCRPDHDCLEALEYLNRGASTNTSRLYFFTQHKKTTRQSHSACHTKLWSDGGDTKMREEKVVKKLRDYQHQPKFKQQLWDNEKAGQHLQEWKQHNHGNTSKNGNLNNSNSSGFKPPSIASSVLTSPGGPHPTKVTPASSPGIHTDSRIHCNSSIMDPATDRATRESNCNISKLAVSVYYLQTTFMKEVLQAGLNAKSTIHDIENLDDDAFGIIRQKGAAVTCPRDGKLGAAYVDCLVGEDNVGRATHMLSYSWSYTIGDIVDTLVDFCSSKELCPTKTYVWICCLCINQHRVAALKKNERSGMGDSGAINFLVEFGDRVQGIGHVLSMMAPWNAPGYLQRTWCVYELYTAHTKGCQVSIVMPPKEKRALEEALLGHDDDNGLDALYYALAKTKVQNAKASVQADSDTILQLVQQYPGVAELNNVVNELLRTWVRKTVQEAIEKRETQTTASAEDTFLLASFYCNVGNVLRANGEENAALKLERQALTLFEGLDQTRHDIAIATCQARGCLRYRNGEYSDALGEYRRACYTHGKHHPRTAAAYEKLRDARQHSKSIGRILQERRDYDGALVEYRKALAIQESALGMNHPRTAAICDKIGDVLAQKKQYDAALVEYRNALAIQESALGKNHPKTAGSYSNIGRILYIREDYDGALVEYRKALAVLEYTLGREHPDTAKLYERIGCVLVQQKDTDGALVMFRKALAVAEYILGKDHPSTAQQQMRLAEMHRGIARALFFKGDLDGSILEERKAIAIYKSAEDERKLFECHLRIRGMLWQKGGLGSALVEQREAVITFLRLFSAKTPARRPQK